MPYINWDEGRGFHAVSGRKKEPSPERETGEESPPLVFIHGAGGSHLDWPPALRRFPDGSPTQLICRGMDEAAVQDVRPSRSIASG